MNQIRHITIINQYIGAPSVGMEYRHYYLAKNLQKLGYKVTLVSGSYSHLFSTPPKVKKSFEKEAIDGIEYIWVKVPAYRSSKSLGRIWNMLYFAWKLRFLKKIPPSHIIVSSPSLFPVKYGKKLAKRFGTKFLFEVRDIWPLTLTELSNISANNPLIKFMEYYEKYAYKNADRVISLLPKAEEYFLSKGMEHGKFVYLPNGIEIAEEDNQQYSVEVAQKIPQNKFIIGYTGTVGVANALESFCEAAKMLEDNKEILFVIVGEGQEKENLIAQFGELENLLFIDAIPKKQVQSMLSLFDVCYIGWNDETLYKYGISANKIFDYMYSRKPILHAYSGAGDIVQTAKCGLSVKARDVSSITGAVEKFFNMSEKIRKDMGENGYNYVINHFAYEKLAEKFQKLL